MHEIEHCPDCCSTQTDRRLLTVVRRKSTLLLSENSAIRFIVCDGQEGVSCRGMWHAVLRHLEDLPEVRCVALSGCCDVDRCLKRRSGAAGFRFKDDKALGKKRKADDEVRW